MSNAAPKLKLSRYPISAAIWENKGKDGRTYFSVTLQKRYKDEKGEWKDSGSFFASDALVAAELLRAAWHAIGKLEDAAYQAGKKEEPKSKSDAPF